MKTCKVYRVTHEIYPDKINHRHASHNSPWKFGDNATYYYDKLQTEWGGTFPAIQIEYTVTADVVELTPVDLEGIDNIDPMSDRYNLVVTSSGAKKLQGVQANQKIQSTDLFKHVPKRTVIYIQGKYLREFVIHKDSQVTIKPEKFFVLMTEMKDREAVTDYLLAEVKGGRKVPLGDGEFMAEYPWSKAQAVSKVLHTIYEESGIAAKKKEWQKIAGFLQNGKVALADLDTVLELLLE